ncbi:MAG: histidine phosphatase family protein [Nitrospirae bacterium]|nr:histidine phosphatase family protein [Nitrospirota bacterium]
MVTTLYLIRHGETVGAETKRYKGHLDVPLSDNGIRQMERVAEYLYRNTPPIPPLSNGGQGGVTVVYCSDLSRAVKSAEIIAGPHGLKPVIIPELKERNFGIWEGMSFDEIREKYPDEFNAWASNPLEHSPIGGESTVEVRDRAVKALGKILNNPPIPPLNKRGERSIAIVSHGGVIRVLLCHFLGVPLENVFRIEQGFAALNIIELHDDYPVVKLINGEV